MGCLWCYLDEAPLGSLLPTEHVLLVAVQHVTGMWVIRGMRMKAYFAATKVEAADAVKFGSLGAALTDAQHLAVGSPVGCIAVAKPKRRTPAETTIIKWAKEMKQKYMATGRLWAVQSNGTSGIGMPQQQFVMGGVQFPIQFGAISYPLYSAVFCSVLCCILKILNTLYSAVFRKCRIWANMPFCILSVFLNNERIHQNTLGIHSEAAAQLRWKMRTLGWGAPVTSFMRMSTFWALPRAEACSPRTAGT